MHIEDIFRPSILTIIDSIISRTPGSIWIRNLVISKDYNNSVLLKSVLFIIRTQKNYRHLIIKGSVYFE